MRRIFAVLMMLICLTFVGCQKQNDPMQNAIDFRTKLLSSTACSFLCDVEADYGDKVYAFSLSCSANEDVHITVTAPENIAGITAEINGEDAVLEYEGVRLEYGELANGYVAPVACPWILFSAWKEDYISFAGTEGELSRVTWLKGYNEEELTVDTWFSESKPVYAEISYGGSRVLTVKIHDFSFEK